MIFWVIAIFLTIVALASVIMPVLRNSGPASSALDYDREIYLARIEEIDADVEIGRLTEDAAAAAKAEEGRKLIASSNSSDQEFSSIGANTPRIILAIVIVAIPAVALATYLGSGQPGFPDMAIETRPDRDPAGQSIVQLLERAEARLASHPDDLRGWAVVAPVYLRLGRVEDAIIAYRNALRLDPDSRKFKVALAEAMVVGAQGIVTEDARKLFSEVIADVPNDVQARFYLAIATSQEGKLEEAAIAWESLIAESPENAAWLPAARAQYAAVQEKRGIAVEPETSSNDDASRPGPSTEDIEAANALNADERQEMIQNMVAGLAERLKQNPDDIEGWRRLIRSYTVLGEMDKAHEAIAVAKTSFASNAEFLKELEVMEGALPSEGEKNQ
ncbi:MAG: c-type cytochrome biogenesis protein CcmI [Rhizobiaceae bacterium]